MVKVLGFCLPDGMCIPSFLLVFFSNFLRQSFSQLTGHLFDSSVHYTFIKKAGSGFVV